MWPPPPTPIERPSTIDRALLTTQQSGPGQATCPKERSTRPGSSSIWMATRRRSSPPTNSDRGYATMKTVSTMALVAALFASSDVYADGAKVTTLMRQPLADYPGKEAVLAAVEYAPEH